MAASGGYSEVSRFGPETPGGRTRYFVLGRLNTPCFAVQRSSSWSAASRSARVSTLRERARPPAFFRLLSIDIRRTSQKAAGPEVCPRFLDAKSEYHTLFASRAASRRVWLAGLPKVLKLGRAARSWDAPCDAGGPLL